MIINAVLWTVKRIVHNVQPKSNVAIIPEVKIDSENGIQINSPIFGYELWLTGTFDYAVVQYTDDEDSDTQSKTPVISLQFIELIDLLDQLLFGCPDSNEVFKLSDGHFLLIKAKQELMPDGSMALCVPKAVGQALAWATITRLIMCPFVNCGY